MSVVPPSHFDRMISAAANPSDWYVGHKTDGPNRVAIPSAGVGEAARGSTSPSEIAKMAQDYIWDIRRRVVYGREIYVWAVIECVGGKTVMSGEELLHSSALKSAMKAIRQVETQNKVASE